MAAERTVTTTGTIPAPQQRVWELVSDTRRYAEWVEGTLEVTRTDGPAAPGSSYDERNTIFGPFKGSSRWTVVEFEPPRRQVHRGEGIAIASELSIAIELAPAGESTDITLTLRYVPAFGPLGTALNAAIGPSLRANQRRSIAQLAELAARELAPAQVAG